MINANRIMKKLSKTKEDKQEVVSELVQETIETVAEIESTPERSNPISDTLESMNYDKFNYVEGNRQIYPAHVKRLKKSINKIGYIKSNPIVIDKDFNIIDGQHRFEACKALHIPVV